MKIFKKIFAVICSLTIAVSMVTGVHAAETIENPLSLAITDNGDNTITVDVKANTAEFTAVTAYLKIPAELKAYIPEGNWTWDTAIDTSLLGALNKDYTYKTGTVTDKKYSYILAAIASATGAPIAVPANDVLVSVTITLSEAIPADVLTEAQRTITLGGEYNGSTPAKRVGATSFGNAAGTLFFAVTPDKGSATPGNNFNYDVTATGNYVVVPAAEAEEEGPAYEGYVGDDDETDVAVGATFDFVPEETTTGIKWTVETNDGVKKSHVSAIDAAGAASYKLGLVIQGLAKSAVKSISAVLQ